MILYVCVTCRNVKNSDHRCQHPTHVGKVNIWMWSPCGRSDWIRRVIWVVLQPLQTPGFKGGSLIGFRVHSSHIRTPWVRCWFGQRCLFEPPCWHCKLCRTHSSNTTQRRHDCALLLFFSFCWLDDYGLEKIFKKKLNISCEVQSPCGMYNSLANHVTSHPQCCQPLVTSVSVLAAHVGRGKHLDVAPVWQKWWNSMWDLVSFTSSNVEMCSWCIYVCRSEAWRRSRRFDDGEITGDSTLTWEFKDSSSFETRWLEFPVCAHFVAFSLVFEPSGCQCFTF